MSRTHDDLFFSFLLLDSVNRPWSNEYFFVEWDI